MLGHQSDRARLELVVDLLRHVGILLDFKGGGTKAGPIHLLERRTTPYGAERGTTGGAWASTRGFVGGTINPGTGLTHIGARQYDPRTGRFVSVDPLLDLSNPSHQNPYAYSRNNPLTFTDPSGLYWGEDKVNAAKNAVGEVKNAAVSVVSTVVNQVDDVVNAIIGPVAAGMPCGNRPCGHTPEVNMSGAIDGLGDPNSLGGNLGKVGGAVIGPLKGSGGIKAGINALKRVLTKPAPPLVSQADEATRLGAGTAARACSFTAPTLVLMADGTQKPISQIEVGELVISTDPETGEQAAKAVEEVFVHEDTVSDLLVDGEILSTTEDHPFWSVTDGRFERADELSGGERVLTADGRTLTVSSLDLKTARTATAYNLSVADIHTYHVGETAILVHNTCPKVNWDMQEKHFSGFNAYEKGKSQLTADPRVLVRRAGTGTPVGPVPRGQNGFKELVEFDGPIGYWVDDAGEVAIPTTRAIFHYGKKGVHVVPIKPAPKS